MNTRVDAKNVLEFLILAIISYALSPIYTYLAGWDMADNNLIRAMRPKGLTILSTFVLLLLLTSLHKCRKLIYSQERVSGELLGLIFFSILPIWVNLMYTASLLAGF